MGGKHVGWHRPNGPAMAFVLSLLAAGLVAACSSASTPLPAFGNGGALVIGPDRDFRPATASTDWFFVPTDAPNATAVVDVSGMPVLRIESPGALLGRRLDVPLLATPHLSWRWFLEPTLLGGGAGDGLPRGLRIVVGFSDGPSRGAQLVDRLVGAIATDYPPHDRIIELHFGGIGTMRPKEALVEFIAIDERSLRRSLRPPTRDAAGRWHSETVDLAALYAAFWPRDPVARVRIGFIAVGGLRYQPPPSPDGKLPHLGYVAEVVLRR